MQTERGWGWGGGWGRGGDGVGMEMGVAWGWGWGYGTEDGTKEQGEGRDGQVQPGESTSGPSLLVGILSGFRPRWERTQIEREPTLSSEPFWLKLRRPKGEGSEAAPVSSPSQSPLRPHLHALEGPLLRRAPRGGWSPQRPRLSPETLVDAHDALLGVVVPEGSASLGGWW